MEHSVPTPYELGPYLAQEQDQIEKLKTVNFIFDVLRDQFNVGFKILQEYFEREGHSNVQDGYKVDGFNLGAWVTSRRREFKKNELSKDRIEKLKTVNLQLWDIENGKRLAEKNNDFGEKFIELARNVYKINDERSRIKLEINNILGSNIKEAKSHY